MRVLLINSNLKKPPVIPLGLCYVASAIENDGHRVHVLDVCFSLDPIKDIERSVTEFKPDVIGISIRNIDNCTGSDKTFHLETIYHEVIRPIKKMFTGLIIIGGPAVGISGSEILDYMNLDYAIKGDGELAIVEFIHRIENKQLLKGLKGLTIRRNGEIIEENEPWRPQDINNLPLPRIWQYIDVESYKNFGSPLQVQTKRGCELNCTYCTYNTIEGKKYRLRNPQKIADEIELLVKKTGINRIEFTDSTFNIPLNHTKAILQAIINKNLDLELQAMGVNPGAVDEELVQLMKKSGFRIVNCSIESGCDAMLKSLGKDFRKEDIVRSGKLLHSMDIPILWYLLLGAPGETPQTLQETFDTLKKVVNPWDFVDIALGVRVYKGSPIAKKLQKENPAITTDNFLKPFILPLNNMEITELYEIIKRETMVRDNYYISGDITNAGISGDTKRTNSIIYRMIVKVLNTIAPRQPVWRVFILFRKIQRLSGMNLVKRTIFGTRNRRQF